MWLVRKPNAHMAFGFALHLCLGAPQARLILRSLMKALCEQVQRIKILKAEPNLEVEAEYRRAVGYVPAVTPTALAVGVRR